MKRNATGRIVRRGRLKVWTGPLPTNLKRVNRLELALKRWLVKRLGLEGAQEFSRMCSKLAEAYEKLEPAAKRHPASR